MKTKAWFFGADAGTTQCHMEQLDPSAPEVTPILQETPEFENAFQIHLSFPGVLAACWSSPGIQRSRPIFPIANETNFQLPHCWRCAPQFLPQPCQRGPDAIEFVIASTADTRRSRVLPTD